MSKLTDRTPSSALIDTSIRSMWRYRAFLPEISAAENRTSQNVGSQNPTSHTPTSHSPAHRTPAHHTPATRITLGEGWTPQVAAPWDGAEVTFKLEWFNPTLSFKDRGTSLMVSHFASQGATEILEDSSGNAGSSVAAYAAAAGIHAKIIMPSSTSPAKIAKAKAFGATVQLVPGDRTAVTAEALRQAAATPYASHNRHTLFLQGTKTIGYEIWEMSAFTVPENVVTVAGAGSIVLGLDLAFRELLAAGLIPRLPRIFVGQPQRWSAIVNAFEGESRAPGNPRKAALPSDYGLPTIAEGAAIAEPYRLAEVVRAVKRSGGSAAAISENEILAAQHALAKIGFYVEPTSAVAASALSRFLAEGVIRRGERTVVILTGSGANVT